MRSGVGVGFEFGGNRLVVENPGGLYGRLAISDLGKAAADTRNPFIAGALEVMAGTENRFSGIPTVVNEMAAAGEISSPNAASPTVWLTPPWTWRVQCPLNSVESFLLAACTLNTVSSIKHKIEMYFLITIKFI